MGFGRSFRQVLAVLITLWPGAFGSWITSLATAKVIKTEASLSGPANPGAAIVQQSPGVPSPVGFQSVVFTQSMQLNAQAIFCALLLATALAVPVFGNLNLRYGRLQQDGG